MLKKKSIIILSTLMLAAFIPVKTDAAVTTKNVQALYNNIKIMYNNSLVPTDIEPFIINGTTYIPVRMMAGVFNKNVTWDGTTYTVGITDKDDPRITSLQAEIAQKDAKIKDLEDQLEKEKQKNDKSDIDDELADLEDDLNYDYGDYKGLDWKISLSGDEDDIDVDIEIDLDEYEDDYNDLSTSEKERLVENICKDIWDKFKDADIRGSIIDSYGDDELHDFNGDARSGDIEFDGDTI
ncbi:stalk domain-containing protein [Brevibacillus sp. B_LB10_24]|uniref:stalk domain-containing protein n=1 Tax=Brevibacillus sp. B_LB10_24 TaxID=3380645 RepID=UPI0038BE14CD